LKQLYHGNARIRLRLPIGTSIRLTESIR